MTSEDNPPNEATNSREEQPLPTVQQLAALAAQHRFAAMPAGLALGAALDMWRQAAERLRRESKIAQLYQESYVNPLTNLRRPVKWPTEFDTFLKCVVGSDRDDKRFQRFKQFLLFELRVAEYMEADKKAVTEAAAKRVNYEPIEMDSQTLDGPAGGTEKEELTKRFVQYRKTPLDEANWDALALRYLRWWNEARSRTKSRAGEKGAPKKGGKSEKPRPS